jgi:hypothetical protein
MLFNPRYGSVGLVGVPYYLLVEVIAPIFELIAVLVLPVAWWAGVLDLREFALWLLTIGLANGALTNIAILFHDRGAGAYPLRDLLRLMLLGVLDICVYRPILICAQVKGLVDFLRGDKAWHKFERNERIKSPGAGEDERSAAASPIARLPP